MNKNAIIPDSLHISERNFKSIIDFCKINDVNLIKVNDFDDVKANYGNYNSVRFHVGYYYSQLKLMPIKELLAFKYRGISLKEVVTAELLSLLLSRPEYFSCTSKDEIIEHAFQEDEDDVLLNFAFGMFWIDFWMDYLKKTQAPLYCFVFSGGLIYQKTFIKIFGMTPTRIFILEQFFTGNEYFFEEKSSHIANNSVLRYKNYYNELVEKNLSKSFAAKRGIRRIALSKFLNASNLNVKQPIESEAISFSKSNTIVILGQVVNDFSLIQTDSNFSSSIAFYKNFIETVFSSFGDKYKIVFKAHPWEHKKANLKTPLTKQYLTNYFLEFIEQGMLIVVDDYNINKLYEQFNIFITLCSQSGIEAAYVGKKVIQFGAAFYGQKGFTYDLNSIDDFINLIKSDEFSPLLSFSEYNNYLQFLEIALTQHCITKQEDLKLKNIMKLPVPKPGSVTKLPVPKPGSVTKLPVPKPESVTKLIINENTNMLKTNQKLLYCWLRIVTKKNVYDDFKSNPVKFLKDSSSNTTKFLGKILFIK